MPKRWAALLRGVMLPWRKDFDGVAMREGVPSRVGVLSAAPCVGVLGWPDMQSQKGVVAELKSYRFHRSV